MPRDSRAGRRLKKSVLVVSLQIFEASWLESRSQKTVEEYLHQIDSEGGTSC